jgi:hypothetical protein
MLTPNHLLDIHPNEHAALDFGDNNRYEKMQCSPLNTNRDKKFSYDITMEHNSNPF